jgi:hypothetical protein
MFSKINRNGKDILIDRYNRVSLNSTDQKKWGLRRAVKNVSAIIEGRVTDSWLWLNRNKYMKIVV